MGVNSNGNTRSRSLANAHSSEKFKVHMNLEVEE